MIHYESIIEIVWGLILLYDLSRGNLSNLRQRHNDVNDDFNQYEKIMALMTGTLFIGLTIASSAR